MFGYIKPYIPDLTVSEYELYKSVYCGLCRKIGKVSRASARLTLSYDYVFAALLFLAAVPDGAKQVKGRCPLHPLKKRCFLQGGEALDNTVTAYMILGYYKADDNVKDGDKVIRSKFVRSVYSEKIKKNAKDIEKLSAAVREELDKIRKSEDSGKYTPTYNAECFGEALAAVFSFNIENETLRRVLSEVGRRIGRFVYLLDAADDFEKDRTKGKYNPFGDCAVLPVDSIKKALDLEQRAAASACELIDFKDVHVRNIIFNVLTSGMTAEINRVFGMKDKKEEKTK